MYVLKVNDDDDSFANFTDNKNEDFIIIFIKYILLSIPCRAFLMSLISFIVWTTLERLLTTN